MTDDTNERMTPLQAALAHSTKVQGEKYSVAVPEWKTSDWDGTIYFRPMTLAEFDKCRRKGKKSDFEQTVAMICLKAEMKDGTRLFTWAEMDEIKKFDMKVVTRIADAMNKVFNEDDDTATDDDDRPEAVEAMGGK